MVLCPAVVVVVAEPASFRRLKGSADPGVMEKACIWRTSLGMILAS